MSGFERSWPAGEAPPWSVSSGSRAVDDSKKIDANALWLPLLTMQLSAILLGQLRLASSLCRPPCAFFCAAAACKREAASQTASSAQVTPPKCLVISLYGALHGDNVAGDAGDNIASDNNVGDNIAGDNNAGDNNAGDSNAGDNNSCDNNAGDHIAGDNVAGDLNASDNNAGDNNAGDNNAGDLYASGINENENEDEDECNADGAQPDTQCMQSEEPLAEVSHIFNNEYILKYTETLPGFSGRLVGGIRELFSKSIASAINVNEIDENVYTEFNAIMEAAFVDAASDALFKIDKIVCAPDFVPCPPLALDRGDSGEEDEKNEDEEPEAMVHHARGLAVPQCKTNPDSDTEGTFCADNYEEIQEEDESDDDELVHCEGPAALRRSGNRAGFSSPIWALHGTMIPGRHFSKSSSASCNTGALAPH